MDNIKFDFFVQDKPTCTTGINLRHCIYINASYRMQNLLFLGSDKKELVHLVSLKI